MKWVECCAMTVLEKGHYAFKLKNRITGIEDIKFETRDSNDTCVAYLHCSHYCKIELPELTE